MEETKQIDASTLRQWLEFKRHILVVDIRTAEERKEWFIPGIVTSRLGKEAFVKNIISKLPPPPSNYLLIAQKNLEGNFTGINPIDLEAGANRCAVS